jgi:putative ABC transport system permease protein
VFIHLDGFYMIPGHEKPLGEARERDKAFGLESAEESPSRERRTFQGPDGKVYTELPDAQKEVTAILVRVKHMTFAPMLQASIKKGPLAQAANPIAEIGKLLRNIVGNIRTVLVVMTALIIVVSGVSIFVSIYNSMSDRRREIAIMRALGASRTTVFSIIIAESILLCTAGGVLGLLIGHALVFIASPVVEARSDILINPWAFELDELIILPALVLLATIVGLVPGLTAYRTDVARGLAE